MINTKMSHEQVTALKIFLFVSGFVILALEVLGIRILAPYVGTTASVWVALIGVTLMGNSVGYYGGGMLADYTQKRGIFLLISANASIFIILIPLFRNVMSIIAPNFSYSTGALIGSVFLFFVPIVLLSALITYSIRIFVKNLDTIGQVHGDLYALATVGSVAGVFSTSYILVPFFTVPHILYGLGTVLLLFTIAVSFPSFTMWIMYNPKTSAD